MGSFSSYMNDSRNKNEEKDILSIISDTPDIPKGSFSQYMRNQKSSTKPIPQKQPQINPLTPLTKNTVMGSVFQGSPLTIQQGGIDKPYNPGQTAQTIQDFSREGLNTFNRIGAGLRSAARSEQVRGDQGKSLWSGQGLRQSGQAFKQGYSSPEFAPTGEDLLKGWGWQNHPGPQIPILGTPRQLVGGMVDFATNPLSLAGFGIGGKIAGGIGGKLASKLPQKIVQFTSVPATRGTQFATANALEAVSRGEPVLPAAGQGFAAGAVLGGLEKSIGGAVRLAKRELPRMKNDNLGTDAGASLERRPLNPFESEPLQQPVIPKQPLGTLKPKNTALENAINGLKLKETPKLERRPLKQLGENPFDSPAMDTKSNRKPNDIQLTRDTLKEQQVAETGPDISRLKQVTAKHRQEVAGGISEANTPAAGQSIKVIGGKFEPGYKPVIPEVDEALKAGQKPLLSLWSKISERASGFINDSRLEPTLKDTPRVREHIRYTKEIPNTARMEATETLEGILGDVERPEMDLFTRKVVYEDWLSSVRKGEKIPFDLNEAQLIKEMDNVNSFITPKLQRAFERHQEVVNAIAEDLITRGKMSREAVRENYFPHKVLFDYGQLLDERIPGLPEKLKTPFRGYVQRREGSVKPMATDYIDTMYKLIAKIKIDNAIDDSIINLAKIGEEYTVNAGVPASIIDKVRRTGIPETYNGKTYKPWQPDTGNYFYPSLTVTEEAVQKALAQQLPGEVQTILGEALKEGLVIGKKKPTYVLPGEVADRLNNFRKHNIETETYKALKDYTLWWKRIAVLMPGLKHDWFNIFGDLDRWTTGLGTKELPGMLVKAAKMVKNDDPALKEMLNRGVFSSEVYIYNTGKYSSAKLRDLSGPAGKFAYLNPVSLYQRWRVYREAIPRIAAQLLNEERVQAGKPIINRFKVNVEGLLPEEAVAKVGRETLVDYNMLSKNTEHARKFWFPFITWYTQNFKSYANMVAKNPAYGLARIFLPMAAVTVWNRTLYPEVEKNLPDYWRENPHLITGIQNDQGGYYIIPVPFAGAIAASMVGLHTVPDTVARYLSGETTLQEAVKKQGKDIVTGPIGAARDLLTPFIKGPAEILANKDLRTGFTIVPRNLKGTPEAWKLQGEHLLKALVPPLSKGMGWAGQMERGEKTPLGARVFGARAFDPEKQKQKDMESLIYDYGSEEIKNEVRHSFIRAYKAYKANSTLENLGNLKFVSSRLSEKQIRNLIDEIENPKTKEDKLGEAIKRVPKALRPELEQKLKDVQNR